jgi:hypothetical protein
MKFAGIPTVVAVLSAAGGVRDVQAAALDLYISGRGRDNWSGKLAEPNRTGTDGPLATIQRARDVVRECSCGWDNNRYRAHHRPGRDLLPVGTDLT